MTDETIGQLYDHVREGGGWVYLPEYGIRVKAFVPDEDWKLSRCEYCGEIHCTCPEPDCP
jgi:hypothetical protein